MALKSHRWVTLSAIASLILTPITPEIALARGGGGGGHGGGGHSASAGHSASHSDAEGTSSSSHTATEGGKETSSNINSHMVARRNWFHFFSWKRQSPSARGGSQSNPPSSAYPDECSKGAANKGINPRCPQST